MLFKLQHILALVLLVHQVISLPLGSEGADEIDGDSTTVESVRKIVSLSSPRTEYVGECNAPNKQRIYTEDTTIENGGQSVVNGTFEIYIDSPVIITCIEMENKLPSHPNEFAMVRSGGLGYNWVFIDVQGSYNKDISYAFHIYGIPDMKKLAAERKSSTPVNHDNSI